MNGDTYAPSQKVPVLSIKNLSKHLGGKPILTDISLDVYPGEVFGFLGPNGSGKTTTIKLMLGLLNMETGTVKICGHDNVKDFEAAMRGIGGIIENPEVYKYLTGRENLMQYARMYGTPDKARIDEVVRTVHLEARIDDKVSKYSLGMRQRLGVAQALYSSPKLLVLDEPTNGLDPAGIKELRELLIELAHKENVAVFISSHMLAELDLLCDRVGIIDRGVLVDTMTIDEIRRAGEGGSGTVSFEIDPETADLIPDSYKAGLEKSGEAEYKCIMSREEIPAAVKELSAAGVRIYAVNTQRHSIEEVFLSLTSEYTPAGGGGSDGYMPKTDMKGGKAQ